MIWQPRTLRGQLTALFLLLTLVPSLTLTIGATRQLFLSLERWEDPEVQKALEGSLLVARDLRDRAQNDLRQRGQLLAAGSLADAKELAARLGDHNLDFLQVYDPEGSLRFEVTRDPLLPGPGSLSPPDPNKQEFLEDRERDLLAYVAFAGDPAGPEVILVAGFYLDRGFYDRLDNLSLAITYYNQLRALKRVNQRAVMLFFGLVALVLAVGSIWVARWLARRVSRPVVDLGRGMERVSHGEDGVRVAPHGPQELERLIETFNVMGGELSRSRRELAQAERLAAWREVAVRVAHEIKNALTPITFSIHRLRKDAPAISEPTRGRMQASLDAVMEEVDGLKRLAASFSELARLPMAELAPLDVGDLLETALDGFSGSGHDILLERPTERMMVNGDRALLRQALTNLIKNAVEASPERGKIWLRASREGTRIGITVEDEGPGWPEGNPDAVLEPYFTTKPEGTGLGLSLVQRTALQHGGAMRLERRPGRGARVTILLPEVPTTEALTP